ncbi:hypothetical protein MJG53_001848 [Ovis ammon polii x Ovis aries]|uniref:Uncharacterized protein n=1 Tax=Ovis ammon polii x Ovis aries TaxID=2918886 RepID=A0ACB9VMP7_9CETA|nr:hypothetical protein MJG53_001848 [Ovis ammon polii x Ovis aries]
MVLGRPRLSPAPLQRQRVGAARQEGYGEGRDPGPSTGKRPAACRPLPPAGCPARAPEVTAVARTRGFRRRAPQDVSSPSPYLVKVFQDSVIQLCGAEATAAALGAGPGDRAAAASLKSACVRPSRRGAAGVPGVWVRACPGDRGRGTRSRTPCEGSARPALRGRLARRAPARLCHFSRPPRC